MTFSLFKYFDAILDGVEQNGLAVLEQPGGKGSACGIRQFFAAPVQCSQTGV